MKLVFESPDLLSMAEAKAALGISAMTLHRWIEAGKIQAVKVGSYRAIPRSEVERLQREH
jgi:putative resolvase